MPSLTSDRSEVTLSEMPDDLTPVTLATPRQLR